MTQHVFARLAGFSLIVIPRAPYRIRQATETTGAVNIEHTANHGPALFAQLIPCDGGYKSKLNQYTNSLFDVVDVEPGPATDEWRIETTAFTCCWPAGYALCSNNFPNNPAPFDLVGERGELIYIQQARRVPDVGDMCAANQSIINIERGDVWDAIDLEYEHDGQRWRQRHVVVNLDGQRTGVTMQTPAKFADSATAAANALATSLAPQALGEPDA